MSRHTHVDKASLVAYAAPGFALSMLTIPVYLYLPALYADKLGIGLTLTGLALLLARLFDAVTDPVIGWLSDRSAWRWGRRKPWILAGAVIAAVGLYQTLFPAADVSWVSLAAWLVVLYLGWTAFAVPYAAWAAELSPAYHERTQITSGREAASLLGILFAGAIPAAIVALGGSERDGIGAIFWAAAILGAVSLMALLWRVSDRPVTREPAGGWRPNRPSSRPEAGVLSAGASLWQNRPFMRLLAAWFINGLANGLPAALFLIYLEHGLAARHEIRPTFIMAYFLAGVATIPFWLKLSRQLGKHRAWCWAMLLACAAFAFVPALAPGDYAAFFVITLLTGAALGADLALPPALQADVVDLDRLRHRRERAGLFFAFWSMATKLALALSAGVALIGLDLAGFDLAADNEDGRLPLIVIYAVIPLVFKVAAVGLVWRFPITPKRQDIIRRRLERNASMAAKEESI